MGGGKQCPVHRIVSEVYMHCLMGVQREGQSIFVIEGVEGTVEKVSKRR